MPTPTLSGGLSLLGHAVTFALRPLKFLESARDRDVVVFRLGTKHAYLVNTLELVGEILVTQYYASPRAVRSLKHWSPCSARGSVFPTEPFTAVSGV